MGNTRTETPTWYALIAICGTAQSIYPAIAIPPSNTPYHSPVLGASFRLLAVATPHHSTEPLARKGRVCEYEWEARIPSHD